MKEDQKFHQEDMEMFKWVNETTETHRKENEARMLSQADAVSVTDIRIANLKMAAGVAVRAAVGCVFLGAITRGFIDPVFGLAVSGACFVWAWLRVQRKSHDNG